MAESVHPKRPSEPVSRLDRTLAADAHALRAATVKVPAIDHTARRLRAALFHAQPATREKEGVMKTLYPLHARPHVLTAGLTCGLLAAVLLWPVSYERTVGHTVTLSLPAESAAATPLGREEVRGIVSRLKQALGAGSVRVSAGGPGAPLVLTARVPSRSRKEVERQLAPLTTALQAEHHPVTSSIAARTEHHTGRVYAMALDKLIDIRVDTTGKSDSQVETEIRDQLTRSGMAPDTVQFQRTGDESQADIQAHDGDHTVRLMRRQRGGPGELHIEAGGLDTERTPGMTDTELREKIERQLTARGLTGTVTVHGDQVQIQAHQGDAAPAAP